MKFFFAVLALAAVACAQQQPIAILRQAQDISPEGSYSYSYETENGINVAESGAPKAPGEEGLAVAAEGQFQYTSPEGQPIAVTYVANENGFQPQGAHLPVAPPVPEQIARAIEYIRSHPSAEHTAKRRSF